MQESEKEPFSAFTETHCSVTHSGDYWLGAFPARLIGIDLQIHKPGRLAALSRRFFHPEEDWYLQAFGFSDFTGSGRQRRVLSNFPAKGSAEISAGFPLPAAGDSVRVDGLQLRFVPFRCDYTLCVCAKEISSVQLVPGK